MVIRMGMPACAMTRRPTLADLPHEVLSHIMRLADQDTRVSCSMATKALCAAARARGVWTAAEFRDVAHPSALEFMDVHGVPHVCIDTQFPDDTAWFFEKLAGTGVDCVRQLRVRIACDGEVPRVPRDFLGGICRQTLLRSLDIRVDNLARSSELVFPQGWDLPSLESVEIVEKTRPELSKELVVFFGDVRMPRVRRLVVDVSLSDVMRTISRLPSLREVVYRYDEGAGGETYEDVLAADATLDLLDINVGCETEYNLLWREVARASVRVLVVHVSDEFVDFRYPLSPALERLELRLDVTHCMVHMDFAHLAEAPNLREVHIDVTPWVRDAAPVSEHVIEFNDTPSIDDWVRLVTRVRLVPMHPSIKLCISSL